MTTISAGTTSTTAYVATPDTTGTLVLKTGASNATALTLDASQNATFAGTLKVNGSTTALYPLVSGTAVASTSGTSIDFTGIPSTAKRITVLFSGVSTSGTSNVLIQLGAGSVEITGYVATGISASPPSGGAVYSSVAGFTIANDNAAHINSGQLIISTLGSNLWSASGAGKLTTSLAWTSGGNKTLAGTLDRIRITTVNGTDTFDAGSVNILWE